MIRVVLVATAVATAGCSEAFRFSEDAGATDAGVDAGRCGLPGACECDGDAGCSSSRPRCGPDNRCVECLVAADCGTKGLCDSQTRRCVTSCVSSTECTAGIRDHCDDQRCLACETAIECSAPTPFCDRPIGYCVGCTSDGQCAAPTGHCDRRSGTCVACLSSSHCAATAYCAVATGLCQPRP